MSKDYARSNNGLIHAINIHGGEHTLCGDAFNIDAGDQVNTEFAWVGCDKGPITCPDCAKIILSVRGMRIRLKPSPKPLRKEGEL